MSMPGNTGNIFTLSSTGTVKVWNASAAAFQTLTTAGVTQQIQDDIQELGDTQPTAGKPNIYKKYSGGGGSGIYVFNGGQRSIGFDQGNSAFGTESNGNELSSANVNNWTLKSTV
jgi:hypothetical protein